jgi:hypothetical protein
MRMAVARQIEELLIGRKRVAVAVRASARAKHISLHVDTTTGMVELVLPRGTSRREGLEFAREKSKWISGHLARMPPLVPFKDGAVIPVFGINRHVRHRPGARGGVWREGNEIYISGQAAHLPRRLTDWLKGEAKRVIAAHAREKAAQINRDVARVSVREVRSRWGSCSDLGNLNFSWRLIFAPKPVMDYVIAHEVAHLVEMNHGKRFWRVVDRITADAQGSRKWLVKNGARLYRYG